MKRGISKKKFCISIDISVYDKLSTECEEVDAKLSTKINSILRSYVKNKND